MVERTRRDIMHAFNTLIAKHNMSQITVEMIVKECGVSKATFYRYFKDKYDVMNYNYKVLLDDFSSPDKSCSFKELIMKIFEYGNRNFKFLQHAFEIVGTNSFYDYIISYSKELVCEIVRMNRNGAGLTEEELLQIDVFLTGATVVFRKYIFDSYPLKPDEVANVLYSMISENLRDYWWV